MSPLDLSPAAATAQTTSPFSVGMMPAAVAQLQKILKDGQFLRIGVYEGGCNGLKLGFEIDTAVEEGDVEFTQDGVRVVSDEMSLSYIDGSMVDYVDDGLRARFALVNPRANHGGCGCGNSFKVAG